MQERGDRGLLGKSVLGGECERVYSHELAIGRLGNKCLDGFDGCGIGGLPKQLHHGCGFAHVMHSTLIGTA